MEEGKCFLKIRKKAKKKKSKDRSKSLKHNLIQLVDKRDLEIKTALEKSQIEIKNLKRDI